MPGGRIKVRMNILISLSSTFTPPTASTMDIIQGYETITDIRFCVKSPCMALMAEPFKGPNPMIELTGKE